MRLNTSQFTLELYKEKEAVCFTSINLELDINSSSSGSSMSISIIFFCFVLNFQKFKDKSDELLDY